MSSLFVTFIWEHFATIRCENNDLSHTEVKSSMMEMCVVTYPLQLMHYCVCIHYYHMSCSFSDASYSRNDRTWMALARISMLCNRAEFKVGQENVPVLKR